MPQSNQIDKVSLKKLYEETIVIDALGGDIAPSSLSAFRAGITAINVTVASPHVDFIETVKDMYTLFTYLDALPDKLLLVKTLQDIELAKTSSRLGIIFGLQDGSSLDGDLTLLTVLYQLGLRTMSLTYNEQNALGVGCMEPHDSGLTLFGRQVVRETNRLGIVLDLSHSSEKTTFDAMKITSKPPIFSHSNPYSLTPSPRCISDSQIKAVAELGGVVGISVYSPMCYSKPDQRPTLSDFLDRIEFVVDKVGIRHVGIGTDIFEGKNPILWRATTKRKYPEMVGWFEHDNLHVEGFETHLEIDNVLFGLAERGYKEEDIKLILGENLLRVFRETFC